VQRIGLGLLGAATAVTLRKPLAPAHMTRRQTIRVTMAHIGDMAARVDALAEEMIERHAEALRLLAEHDAGSR